MTYRHGRSAPSPRAKGPKPDSVSGSNRTNFGRVPRNGSRKAPEETANHGEIIPVTESPYAHLTQECVVDGVNYFYTSLPVYLEDLRPADAIRRMNEVERADSNLSVFSKDPSIDVLEGAMIIDDEAPSEEANNDTKPKKKLFPKKKKHGPYCAPPESIEDVRISLVLLLTQVEDIRESHKPEEKVIRRYGEEVTVTTTPSIPSGVRAKVRELKSKLKDMLVEKGLTAEFMTAATDSTYWDIENLKAADPDYWDTENLKVA